MSTPRTPEKRSSDRLNRKEMNAKKPTQCLLCMDKVENGMESTIKCKKCSEIFHLHCVDVSENFYKKYLVELRKPWFCYSCYVDICDSYNNYEHQINSFKQEMHKFMNIEFQKLKSSASSLRQEFDIKLEQYQSDMGKTISDLKQEMNNKCSDILTDCLAEISIKIDNSSDKLRQETLQETNESEIKKQIELQERFNRKLNLVLSGIPTSFDSKNLKQLIIKLSSEMGTHLEPNFIDMVHRIGKTESKQVLLKFKFESEKNIFFEHYLAFIKSKENKKLTLSDFNITDSRRDENPEIFINHHLTPALTSVLFEIRNLHRSNVVKQFSSRWSHISILINEKWVNIPSSEKLRTVISELKNPGEISSSASNQKSC